MSMLYQLCWCYQNCDLWMSNFLKSISTVILLKYELVKNDGTSYLQQVLLFINMDSYYLLSFYQPESNVRCSDLLFPLAF